MRDAGRRRERDGGFTTLEMLLTTLILALATAVGASGVYTTNAVYQRTMAKSDAQMLLSQAETRLRDEIGLAKKIRVDRGDLLYSRTQGGVEIWYEIVVSDGRLCRYGIGDPDVPVLDENKCAPLVTYDEERMEDLKVTYGSIDASTRSDGYVTVKDLKIRRDGDELAGRDLVIPWMNAGL